MCSAVPVFPWRYARTDTNVGNRFVVDRYYNLFSASNQFTKSTNWFTLKTKMKRKSEDLGRASPLNALVGTVSTGMGAGGAAMGCAAWQACKEHVAQRHRSYTNIAYCGMFSAVLILFGIIASVAVLVMKNVETQKHKKKKHHEDQLSPQAKTMVAGILSFAFPFVGTAAFTYILDSALNDFKNTAYYPYAASYVAPYIGGMGCAINFVVMMLCINRVTPLAELFKGEPTQEGDAMMAQGAAPSGAYGNYPPPGAYGEAYGAYPQGEQGAYPGPSSGYAGSQPIGAAAGQQAAEW